MNALTLREHYSNTSFEVLKQKFRESTANNSNVYFAELDKFLIPYSALVKNLFSVPDRFERHPSIQAEKAHAAYQKDMALLHAAQGIAGECFEVDNFTDAENLLEELGDLLFYVVAFLQASGFSISALSHYYKCLPEEAPFYTSIVREIAREALEVTKKVVFYQHPSKGIRIDDEALYTAISNLLGANFSLKSRVSYIQAVDSLKPVIQGNIHKLLRRYPTLTFSIEASYVRADKASKA